MKLPVSELGTQKRTLKATQKRTQTGGQNRNQDTIQDKIDIIEILECQMAHQHLINMKMVKIICVTELILILLGFATVGAYFDVHIAHSIALLPLTSAVAIVIGVVTMSYMLYQIMKSLNST